MKFDVDSPKLNINEDCNKELIRSTIKVNTTSKLHNPVCDFFDVKDSRDRKCCLCPTKNYQHYQGQNKIFEISNYDLVLSTLGNRVDML